MAWDKVEVNKNAKKKWQQYEAFLAEPAFK